MSKLKSKSKFVVSGSLPIQTSHPPPRHPPLTPRARELSLYPRAMILHERLALRSDLPPSSNVSALVYASEVIAARPTAGPAAGTGTLGRGWDMARYLSLVVAGAVGQDCLTGTWVPAHGRFLLIDLGAGPFEWGPQIGGAHMRAWNRCVCAGVLRVGLTGTWRTSVWDLDVRDTDAVMGMGMGICPGIMKLSPSSFIPQLP